MKTQLVDHQLKYRAIFWIMIAVMFDQITKYVANTYLSMDTVSIIPNFFQLQLVFNTGAAFSILPNARWFFIPITVIILVYGWKSYEQYMVRSGWFFIGGILFFAGTLGNFLDRLFFGQVTDFLAFIFGTYHFAIFNFADTFLCIGIFILIIGLYLYEKKMR